MTAPAASTLLTNWAGPAVAAEVPPARALALPSVEQGLAYSLRSWAAALPGQLRRHRLLPARAGCYSARFRLGAALGERFAELFDLRHGPGGVAYPFLHAQSVITLLQARVLADLGVNRRHVLQLRHRTRLPAGVDAFLAAGDQQLDCRLQRVVRISPTEVLVLLETRISEPGSPGNERTLALVEDGFIVRHLQVAYAVQAEEDDLLRRAVSRMRRHTPEIDIQRNDVRLRQLYIAPDAGRRFGRVSGERNPMHAGRLGARLMGQSRPFVQAQYLRNLVARELAEWGVDPAHLQLTFTSRAGLGQTLCLLLQGDVWELIDERNRLIAFGKT